MFVWARLAVFFFFRAMDAFIERRRKKNFHSLDATFSVSGLELRLCNIGSIKA